MFMTWTARIERLPQAAFGVDVSLLFEHVMGELGGGAELFGGRFSDEGTSLATIMVLLSASIWFGFGHAFPFPGGSR